MPDSQSFRLPVYLDHHATTPVDPRVLEAMLPYFTEIYGNAASVDHLYGAAAQQAVDSARKQIAQAINAKPEEIIFTSGATEADNLALIGVAEQYSSKGRHIITCLTEHKAILDTCKYLAGRGYDITLLPVDSYGSVDPDDVKKAIRSETILISIMTANNEIGTIAPIAEIGKIAREHQVLFHTDATQAVGYVPLDVDVMNIDLLSMSAHKVYGPKGVGGLYVRKISPRVKLVEQMHGGGHERGFRSGTLNVPGIVGFGAAVDISKAEMPKELSKLTSLRNELLEGLQKNLGEVLLNGHPKNRLPHNLSIALLGIDSRSILANIKKEVAISIGSACTTSKVEPSHVILALGFGEARAYSSLRFGLGRSNTGEQVNFVVKVITSAVTKLRKLSS